MKPNESLSKEEAQLLEGMPVRREKRKPVRRTRRVLSLEGHLRRSVAQEIGDDEISREEHFQLLEKFGVSQPRFTKNVKKPSWMEEETWKKLSNKLAQWFPSKTNRPKHNHKPTLHFKQGPRTMSTGRFPAQKLNQSFRPLGVKTGRFQSQHPNQ